MEDFATIFNEKIKGQRVADCYTYFSEEYYEMYGLIFKNGYKYVVGYDFDPQTEFIIDPNNNIIATTESYNK